MTHVAAAISPECGFTAPGWLQVLGLGLCWALLSACSPSLDWREVRPAGTAVVALFPCKPSSQQRNVKLAGGMVALSLHACQAGTMTWALSHADLARPDQVAAALAELRTAAQTKMGEPLAPWAALPTPGFTPNAQSGRASFAIRSPEGQPLQMQLAVFAHGTRVFQATVLGASIPSDAANSFFGALRIAP